MERWKSKMSLLKCKIARGCREFHVNIRDALEIFAKMFKKSAKKSAEKMIFRKNEKIGKTIYEKIHRWKKKNHDFFFPKLSDPKLNDC